MPFERRDPQPRPSAQPDLRKKLLDEFRTSSDAEGAPKIVAEPLTGDITRLYVIWDDWGELSLRDRSEIILDAYQGVFGEENALKIALAMGVSSQEAQRMNLLPNAPAD